MKMITPIIGISKIIGSYQTIICGFDGVLSKGDGLLPDALKAVRGAKENKKDVVLFSNSPLRIWQMAEQFEAAKFDLHNFKAMITAGEVLHYKLKNNHTLGKKYYNLGGTLSKGVFASLPYVETHKIQDADFIFIGDIHPQKLNLEDYEKELQEAASLHLPLVCVGTDITTHIHGEVALSAGGVAEQYAIMGGRIMTVSKTDADMLSYVKECCGDGQGLLLIGDGYASDMKAASMLKADMVLVAKGVHVHALGEGYIPDVQKARDLAVNYNLFPNYMISELRF